MQLLEARFENNCGELSNHDSKGYLLPRGALISKFIFKEISMEVFQQLWRGW